MIWTFCAVGKRWLLETLDGVTGAGLRGSLDANRLGWTEAVAHILELERLSVVVER